MKKSMMTLALLLGMGGAAMADSEVYDFKTWAPNKEGNTFVSTPSTTESSSSSGKTVFLETAAFEGDNSLNNRFAWESGLSVSANQGLLLSGKRKMVSIQNLKKDDKVTIETGATNLYIRSMNVKYGNVTLTTSEETEENLIVSETEYTMTADGSFDFSTSGSSSYRISKITITPKGSDSGSDPDPDPTPDAQDQVYENITIPYTSNGQVAIDNTDAQAGDEVTLTITPAIGYELEDVTVIYEVLGSTANSDGAGFAAASRQVPSVGKWGTVEVTNNKFTMPNGPVVIKATFVENVTTNFTLTVNKEWMTFCSPKTFAVPEGLKAYTISAVTQPADGETGTLTITEQTIVEAGVPMLLENADYATTTQFSVTETDGSVTGTSIIQYKGITETTNIGSGCYVLVDGEFLRTEGGSLAAYNCYLDFGTANAARGFNIVKDEATGLSEISSSWFQVSCSEYFDLNGRRVAQPTKPGLYISGGKKFVVK